MLYDLANAAAADTQPTPSLYIDSEFSNLTDTTLRPLPDQSIAERVTDEIRAAIHDGRYPPGMRLVERRLADMLGVSHIPVREALARLADEGLVERLPRRGSRVAGLSIQQLQELSSIRILLEEVVVVRVQERLNPRIEAELDKLVTGMEEAARRGNEQRVFDLDQRLHERLWALAEHSILHELVSQLRGRISAFLRGATSALDTEELEQHAATHRELVDAITKGSPKDAKSTVAKHISAAAERLERQFAASADASSDAHG